MANMVQELESTPENGLLHVDVTAGVLSMLLFGSPIQMVQYWKSEKHLIDYARSRDQYHYPVRANYSIKTNVYVTIYFCFCQAWVAFNKAVRADDQWVGIYHETYIIGKSECIFRGMPTGWGILAAAEKHKKVFGTGGLTSIGSQNRSAKQRLGQADEDVHRLQGFKDDETS